MISLFDSNRSKSCFPSVWTMCLHNFSISSTPRIESIDSFKQFSYCMSNSSLSISPFSITGCHFVSITSFSWNIQFLENGWFWKRSRSFSGQEKAVEEVKPWAGISNTKNFCDFESGSKAVLNKCDTSSTAFFWLKRIYPSFTTYLPEMSLTNLLSKIVWMQSPHQMLNKNLNNKTGHDWKLWRYLWTIT